MIAMSELESLKGRRQILHALLFSVDNAHAIIEFCASASPDAAIAADTVAGFFGITEFQAEVILDMPLRRFSPHAVASIRKELLDVESELDRLDRS